MSQHLLSFWGEEEAEPGVSSQSYAKVTDPNVLMRFPIIVLTIGNLTCFQSHCTTPCHSFVIYFFFFFFNLVQNSHLRTRGRKRRRAQKLKPLYFQSTQPMLQVTLCSRAHRGQWQACQHIWSSYKPHLVLFKNSYLSLGAMDLWL